MAPRSSTLAWKNPMDGGAWKAVVHGVAEGQTRLSNFTELSQVRLEFPMNMQSR